MEKLNTVLAEYLEPLDEAIPGVIKVLVNRLKTFRCDCFDSYQGAFDVSFAHGVEILSILRRFHGDLRKEDHVSRQLG